MSDHHARDRLVVCAIVVGAVSAVVLPGGALVGAEAAGASEHTKAEQSPMNVTVTWRAESGNPHAPGAGDVTVWAFARGFPVDLTPIGNLTLITPAGQRNRCQVYGRGSDVIAFGMDRDSDRESDTGADVRPIYRDVTFLESFSDTSTTTREDGTNLTYFDFLDDGEHPGDATGVHFFEDDEIVYDLSACFTHPERRGWYRWYVHINGSIDGDTDIWRDDTPDWGTENWWGDDPGDLAAAYSHWYYICNCSNRSDAEQTLGLPPDYHPHRSRSVRAPNYEPSLNVTLYAPGSTDRLPPPTPAETATPTPFPTPTPSPTATPTETPDTTTTAPATDSPSSSDASGFGVFVGLIALVTALLGVGRVRG